MVVTQYIKCSSCDEKYRVRIGFGLDGYQNHYLDCINCYLPIIVAVKATPPQANVQVVSNCEIIFQIPDKELTIINFHPACAFNKKDLHDPKKVA